MKTETQTSDSVHLIAGDGQPGPAPTPLKYRAGKRTTSVLCEGRLLGHIHRTLGGGYRYYPKGSTAGGDVFRTEAECRRSLEAA